MATTTAMPGRFAATGTASSSFWDLLFAITARDMRVKYQGTVLSYFWWVARPLTLGLVLYFAMSRVLDVGIQNHAGFLLSALFPWFWFQTAVFSATGAFVANAGLIKKVRFPRVILPLSVVLASTVEFVVTIPILLLLMLFTGVDPSWTWLAGIPILLLFQFVLLCGIGCAAAALNVYIRDLSPALNSVLTLLFYLTPIIYPLERVPEGYRQVLRLNPLAPLLEAWRALLMTGDMPGADLWPAAVFTIASLVVAAWSLRVTERNMADAL